MTTTDRAVSWLGLRVTDAGGHPVGKLQGIYVDRRAGEPRWLLISTGHFGGHSVLAPATDAAAGNGIVMLGVTRGAVRSAPRPALAHAPLAAGDDRALARHYRLWPRLRELAPLADHVTSASPVTRRTAVGTARLAVAA